MVGHVFSVPCSQYGTNPLVFNVLRMDLVIVLYGYLRYRLYCTTGGCFGCTVLYTNLALKLYSTTVRAFRCTVERAQRLKVRRAPLGFA